VTASPAVEEQCTPIIDTENGGDHRAEGAQRVPEAGSSKVKATKAKESRFKESVHLRGISFGFGLGLLLGQQTYRLFSYLVFVCDV